MDPSHAKRWLSDTDWKRTQQTMPIPCVDVVPVRLAGGVIEQVGLIYRETPHQGRRWCIVGGRLWRDESLGDAVTRQLRDTLGHAIRFTIDPEPQPDWVVSYFDRPRDIGLLDPRQHAITLNFVVPIDGEVTPGGEAIDFRWYALDHLPPADAFGFGQKRVVRGCLFHRGITVPE